MRMPLVISVREQRIIRMRSACISMSCDQRAISMPSACHQRAISVPSACHQLMPWMQARAVGHNLCRRSFLPRRPVHGLGLLTTLRASRGW